MSKQNRQKSEKKTGKFLGLTAVAGALFGLQGANAASAQSDTPPEGYKDARDIDGFASFSQQADGTVILTLEDGEQIVLAASDVIVSGNQVYVLESVFDDISTGILDAITGAPVPVILGAGALGAGVLAGSGGNDGGNSVAPPIDAAPVFSSSATVSISENGLSVFQASASDTEGSNITYSISGGADAARFEIDSNTGQVTFVSQPDFEVPGDADADNVYDLEITASDGTNTTTQTVAISVTDENDVAPSVTSGASASVVENQAAAYTAAASDPDGGALTYSISGGADAALFAIDPTTGSVTFISSPDFETPGDADADNVYDVEITVSDGVNSSAQSISISVTNANDVAPVFSSSAAASAAENQTGAFTASASDAEGDSVTYSLTGGSDVALFTIDPSSGVVSFLTAPDFEAPADADADNVYDVEVTASDGTNSTTQTVSVSVTDVNDNAPVFTSAASASAAENQTGAYTATATDPNGDTITFSISGGTDAGLFSIDPTTGVVTFNAAPNFEVPGDADADNVYDLEITASDGTNTTAQAVAISVTDENDAPVFNQTSYTINEGSVLSGLLSIVDEDGSTFAPTAFSTTGGADNSSAFAFLGSAGNVGIVRFAGSPDFENPSDANGDNVFEVEVTLTDGGVSTTQLITFTVIDVDEAPDFSSASSITSAENQASGIYTAVATDQEGATVTYSIVGGADAALFTIDPNSGSVDFLSVPDAETPADSNADNVYNLQIGASDQSGNQTTANVSISVSDVNDNSPSFTSNSAFIIEDDQTAAFTATADDPDSSSVLTFSITGGADAALFNIDPTTGAVSFVNAPDALSPSDANADNVFEVEVTVDDGINTVSQLNTVEVYDPAPTVSSTGLTTAQGFIVQGDAFLGQAGTQVAAIGDVNGDGVADFALSAPEGDDGGTRAGEVYVIFGGTGAFGNLVSGRQVISVSGLSASEGFIIQGDRGQDELGSVSSAGDINGDGIDDIFVGATLADGGGSLSGEGYVVFGSSSPFGASVNNRQVVDLTTLSSSEGFVIFGDAGNDRAGTNLAVLGDINGDGFDDIAITAPSGDDGGGSAGEAYVIFGSDAGFGTPITNLGNTRQVIDLTNLTPSEGFVVQGDEANDFVFSVNSVGDINGDGFDDFLVGAIGGDDGDGNAGEAYIVFGTSAGFGALVSGRNVLDLTTLSAAEGFIIQGDAGGDQLGFAGASAGDVNGDGYDDILVGADRGDDGGVDAGEAYVVYGGSGVFGNAVTTGGATRQVLDLTTLTPSQGYIVQGSEDSVAGSAVAGGDINGDGYSDILIGAPDRDFSTSGDAYVLFGGATAPGELVSGRQVVDLALFESEFGYVLNGDSPGDAFGSSVALADINGDGFADTIIGAPGGDDAASLAGEAYVVFGGQFQVAANTPVNQTGTTGADQLIGNIGADTLIGNGGADVIRGGAGDDSMSIADATFVDIDGGSGSDTLALSGSGITLNLTTTGTAPISSVEVIDLTGSGNNTLTLDAQAVFDLTEERQAGETIVRIDGNSGDAVNANGFTANGAVTINSVTYNVYEDGNAIIQVQNGVTVNLGGTTNKTSNASGTVFVLLEDDSEELLTEGALGAIGEDAPLESIDPLNWSVTSFDGEHKIELVSDMLSMSSSSFNAFDI